ncbi:MAG: hypothetical protein ACOY3L_03205 [Pseudomonadota bacterium]
MTPNDRVETLTALTERLAACLEHETALLGKRRREGLTELQREKSRLAQAYEGEIRLLKEGSASLAGAEPARLRRLTESGRRLQEAVTRNERALKAARTVNERILTAMVDAIETQRGRPVGYTGRGARPPAAAPRRAGAVAAVTLDQRF